MTELRDRSNAKNVPKSPRPGLLALRLADDIGFGFLNVIQGCLNQAELVVLPTVWKTTTAESRTIKTVVPKVQRLESAQIA